MFIRKEIITLGVTGHRFLTDVKKIETGIETVLCAIEHEINRHKVIQVMTSLAEGADRLVAEKILNKFPSSKLIAVLPKIQEEYLKDFESEESKKEFMQLLNASRIKTMPTAKSKELAYFAACRYIARHSDVLIAVWDGLSSQGLGGTSDIINSARHIGIPIAWIHAGNRKPGTQIPTSLGKSQGQVTFENFQGLVRINTKVLQR